MAWIWNRILPKATRAKTTLSARIDGYVVSKIRSDGPGLALTVVKAGAVVHAAGYGLADRRGHPITPDTVFHLASCGKQFTGLGIAMLAEEGKLHLDDPVAKHLPLLAAFGPLVTSPLAASHLGDSRSL
jgi:CubicO group peptidase (beta-lactamase class C family)